MKQNVKKYVFNRYKTKNKVESNIISQEGFDFLFDCDKCVECGGKCCYGESGYIFATIAEIKAVSDFLDIPFEDFCLIYVKRVGMRFSFIEKLCIEKEKGVSCVFFDEKNNQCSIYPVRPKQCKTFPFWNVYKQDKNELTQRCIGVLITK